MFLSVGSHLIMLVAPRTRMRTPPDIVSKPVSQAAQEMERGLYHAARTRAQSYAALTPTDDDRGVK